MHYGIGNVARTMHLRWNGSGLANPQPLGGVHSWTLGGAAAHSELSAVGAALQVPPARAEVGPRVVIVSAADVRAPDSDAYLSWQDLLRVESDTGCVERQELWPTELSSRGRAHLVAPHSPRSPLLCSTFQVPIRPPGW